MFEKVIITTPYGKLDEVLKITNDTDETIAYTFNDILEIDATYTFSCWMKSNVITETEINISDSNDFKEVSENWNKIVFTAVSNIQYSKEVLFTILPGVTVYVYEGQLEAGTMDTDFSVNPKDTDHKIAQLELTIDGFRTEVSNTYATKELVSTVDGKFAEYSTTSQMNSIINQKVNEITASVSSIYATKTELLNTDKKVSDAIESIETTLSNYATLEITDQKISSAVSASETTVKKYTDGKIETAESNAKSYVDQTATGIITSVSSEITQKINNIAIGVRNLFALSKSENGYLNKSCVLSPQNPIYKEKTSDFIDVSGNKQIVLQMWCTTANEMLWECVAFYDSNKTLVGNRIAFSESVKDYAVHIIDVPSNAKYVRSSTRMYSDGKVKIEYGNKPTAWTPAPEDVDSSISSIETRVSVAEGKITSDAIVLTVRKSTEYINDLGEKVSSDEIISSINQTAETVKIDASKIELNGRVTFGMFDASTQGIINNAKNDAATALNQIRNIEIGDSNILLGSNVEKSNNSYQVSQYKPTDYLTPGRTYTAVICVTPATNVDYISFFVSAGYVQICKFNLSGTGKQTVKVTFTMPNYASGRTPSDASWYGDVYAYRFPNDGTVTGNTTIHWVKIVSGNKTSNSWTPAPEETEEELSKLNGVITNWCYNNDKTIIDGGKIYCSSLSAISANLGNITAGSINIGNGKFKVTSSGVLTATGANITGTINASTGKIAGFTIDANYIQSSDKTIGFGNTSDWAFWAGGSTSDTAKFRVTKAGKVYAKDLEVTGGKLISDSTLHKVAIENGRISLTYKNSGDSITFTPLDVSITVEDDLVGYPTLDINSSLQLQGQLNCKGNVRADMGLRVLNKISLRYNDTTIYGLYSNGSNNIYANAENGYLALYSHGNAIYYDGAYVDSNWTAGKFYPGKSGVALGGNTTTTRWYRVYSANADNISSDLRLKTNITEFDERYLKLFEMLRPVVYNWKSNLHSNKEAGLIAQEVQYAMSQCGITNEEFGVVEGSDEEYYSLIYSHLHTLNIYYSQEKNKYYMRELSDHERRIQDLENENARLNQELINANAKLEAFINGNFELKTVTRKVA